MCWIRNRLVDISAAVRAMAVVGCCVALSSPAFASFTYLDDFKGSTAPGWNFVQEGSSPGPRLTSGATAIAADPEVGTIDAVDDGWLRMTTLSGDQANSAYFTPTIPSSDGVLSVSFEFTMWEQDGAGAGDGFTFFMYDAAEGFDPGATGGSMGYAQKFFGDSNPSNEEGMAGGYIGVGFDNWGNYSNPTEGRIGGPGFLPNEVVLRGPGEKVTDGGSPHLGEWYEGYEYLAGTGGTNETLPGTPSIPSLTSDLDFPTATSRPDTTGVDYRGVRIILDDMEQLSVELEVGSGSGYTTLFTADLSSYDRPDDFGFGFSAGTGAARQVIEIRNFGIVASGDPSTFFWDNDAGGGSGRRWGAAGAPNDWETNWLGDVNPYTISGKTPHVVFQDSYISGNQTIRVRDGDKTINNMTFSGQYRYILRAEDPTSGSSTLNPKLIFDVGTSAATESNIVISPSGTGGAAHQIQLDIQMNNDLRIDHLIDTHTFQLRGDIDMGANDLTVNTIGTVRYRDNPTGSREITGTGDLIKEGVGTLEIENDNLNFTGRVVMNEGEIRAEATDSLGGVTEVIVNDGLLNAIGERSLGSATDITINDGTLRSRGVDALQSAETININGGTLLLARNNTINSTADLNLNGGTLATDGKDQTLDTLTLTANSTIDLGVTGSGTSRLTFTSGVYTSGLLTITNWDGLGTGGGDDRLVFDTALSQDFLNNVYWGDLGITGAVQLPSGEIVPIPEPGTLLVGGLLSLLAGKDFLRRRQMRNSLLSDKDTT